MKNKIGDKKLIDTNKLRKGASRYLCDENTWFPPRETLEDFSNMGPHNDRTIIAINRAYIGDNGYEFSQTRCFGVAHIKGDKT